MARNGARGCVRPCAAEGFFWAGEGEVAGGEIRGILQFEPIKSMVSRGLSPMRAGRGRKRSLKLVGDTDGKCMVMYFRFEIQEEFMTTTLRIDDGLKRDCDAIFDDLGLSMAGAVTIFLKQVVKQRGIPFVITCDRQTSVGHLENTAVMLAERSRMARRYAAEMRNANEREWTMDEINAEIKAARRERKARING